MKDTKKRFWLDQFVFFETSWFCDLALMSALLERRDRKDMNNRFEALCSSSLRGYAE